MAKKLTELTARTATAGTDLIHVNSGGTDYKQTKADFLSNTVARNVEFANNTTLTSQVDALDWGPYTGYIAATTSTSLAATGMPVQATYALSIYVYSNNMAIIHADAIQGVRSFTRRKSNGSWGEWIEIPATDKVAGGIASVGAQSSQTFTIENNSRILLVIFGASTGRNAVYNIFATSAGVITSTPVLAGSYCTITTGTNQITIANSMTGSGNYLYINALVFAGSISVS